MKVKKHQIAIFLFIFLAFGCSPQNLSETKKPIRIGVDAFPGWDHIFIAQKKGFFEKNGVSVDIVYHKDYPDVNKDFILSFLQPWPDLASVQQPP